MRIEEVILNEERPEVSLLAYSQNFDAMKGPRPAVIILAGGSFMYKSEREAEPIALKFLGMGYQAFVLNYTTYTEGNQKADYNAEFVSKPHTQFPTQLKEMAEAFHVIHKHADRWHVDVDKIGLCGFSAGGYHAAMYGSSWHSKLVSDLVDYPASELRPAFMILSYALTDSLFGQDFETANYRLSQLDGEAGNYSKAIMMANYGSINISKETAEKYIPANYVNTDTPPAFIWSTFEDALVPVQQSIAFAKTLADHKVPVELHIFEKGGHGLATAKYTTARGPEERDLSARHWFDLVEEWLAIHAPISND